MREVPRVTMPVMGRALLLFVALVIALPACARTEAPAPDDDAAAATAEALADLDERVATLEADLASLETARERAGNRLRKLSGRLKGALDRLRDSLAEVRATAGTSGDNAAAALATANSAARDLEVLEERYDYHLRRYHGGG